MSENETDLDYFERRFREVKVELSSALRVVEAAQKWTKARFGSNWENLILIRAVEEWEQAQKETE